MKILISSLLVICSMNSTLSSEQRSQVYQRFPDDRSMFYREQREVPNDELVNIKSKTRHRIKRETPRSVEFIVDGKNFVFNLRSADHAVMSDYVEVWRAKTVDGRSYTYEFIDQTKRPIGGYIFQDPEKMGSFRAYYRGSREIYYDGVFGEADELKVVNGELEKPYYSGDHVVSDVNLKIGKKVTLQPHEILNISAKLDKPLDTFNIKLLVVVDYSLFEKLDKDINKTIRYMATFWNAVNLKYTQIEIPKIKITVTGLIISEDLTAMEYIYKARNQLELNLANATKIIDFGGEYFNDNFQNSNIKFENYDAVITMANLIAIGLYGEDVGLAYPGGICSENSNVLYVKDDGNYAGLIRATHELAHSLNIWHDGQYRDHNCTNYSSEEDTSTVMAESPAPVKKYVWSECSLKHFQIFAWRKTSICLKDTYRYRH